MKVLLFHISGCLTGSALCVAILLSRCGVKEGKFPTTKINQPFLLFNCLAVLPSSHLDQIFIQDRWKIKFAAL